MSTPRYAIRLVGQGVPGSLAGGKGSALDRLIGLDAHVPATGVVTTDAYRAFTALPPIATFIESLRDAAPGAPADHAAARARVDEVFLGEELPAPVARQVDRLAARIASGGSVAYRSSATAEDLGNASFAGQYETYLDRRAEDAHDLVRLVWASLWYPSPRAYRHYRGIAEDDLAMAVVIMRMLTPSHAGVLFTVDPGGRHDAMRLEVVEGLGEQLVSGAVTPDAHVVPRDDAPEVFATIATPLGDLAREALRLEDALGAPQDIEFALEDDELFLVQARPITTEATGATHDDGFDFSCGLDTTYTTAGIAEMLPGVVPPLLWSIDSWLIENGFRALFDMLGGDAAELTDGHALIGRFHGRAALNLDAMRRAAGSIPGGSPEELEEQYFGAVVKTDETNRRTDEVLHRSGAARARQGTRVLRARRRAAEQAEVAVQTVRLLIDAEPDVTTMDDDALTGYWNRLLHVAQIVAVAEVAVAAMASASYRGVEVFLSRYSDSATAAQRARAITAHGGGQRRARIAMSVEPIVEDLRADKALAAAVVEDWSTTRDVLGATPDGQAIVRRLETTWRRAGSTGMFAGPTWAEVPQLAWLVAYRELRRPPARPIVEDRTARRREIEAQLSGRPRWRSARLAGMQLFDVRRRFFRRTADEAAEFLDRREATKAAFLQLGGMVRRCHIELAARLVDRGRLERIEDIAMLSAGEIPAAIAGHGPTPQRIARRRRIDEQTTQLPGLPLVFTGTPGATPPPVPTGERFEGWSASPGRYEGRARVVISPDATDFCRGDILIAESTDATWTPLFLAAGAIVVEQGGPLSHAAIVARELGVPAVVNVPGFVARMVAEGGTADMVVDGTAGVVTIRGAGRAEADSETEPGDVTTTGAATPDDAPSAQPRPVDEAGSVAPRHLDAPAATGAPR